MITVSTNSILLKAILAETPVEECLVLNQAVYLVEVHRALVVSHCVYVCACVLSFICISGGLFSQQTPATQTGGLFGGGNTGGGLFQTPQGV